MGNIARWIVVPFLDKKNEYDSTKMDYIVPDTELDELTEMLKVNLKTIRETSGEIHIFELKKIINYERKIELSIKDYEPPVEEKI